jgi:hypothetical protein
MAKTYSAVADQHSVTVFNAEKGIKEYTISLGSDVIINGPVVTGDNLSLVTKDTRGKMRGRVYSLSKGQIRYTFNVR